MFKLANYDKHKSVIDDYELLVARKMNLKRELNHVSKDLDSVNDDIDEYKRKFRDHVIDRKPDEAEEANDKVESLIEMREFLEKQKMETRKELVYLIGYLDKIDGDIRKIKHWLSSVKGDNVRKPTPDV